MGTRVSGAPLQQLFEDSRYLPIVTLQNKAGRTPSFYLKQCSMQICGNKSNHKSAPDFPSLPHDGPIDSASRGGAERGGSNVIDSPGGRGRGGV